MRTVDAAGLPIGEDVPPRIMGVINVSPESPYDPSVYTDPEEAAIHVDNLIDQGADIIDVGLASANKRFRPLTPEEELDRLELAVNTIASVSGDAVFSIETRYHEVAASALDRGFVMVNDVCGFADPELPAVCADYGVAVVKMASPPDLQRPGALESVEAIHEGITRGGFTEKTIIDPAFGGWSEDKTLADDRETFHRLREFRAYGRPILVSINRKNFLKKLADRSTEEALPVSLAATSLAVERGVSVIRTHDVAETRDAAIIGDELGTGPTIELSGEVDITALDTIPFGALRRQLSERNVDQARAGDWSWWVFSVTGIDEVDEWSIETVEQAGLAVYGSDPLVIAGPIRAFHRVNRIVEDLPSPLNSVMEQLAKVEG